MKCVAKEDKEAQDEQDDNNNDAGDDDEGVLVKTEVDSEAQLLEAAGELNAAEGV